MMWRALYVPLVALLLLAAAVSEEPSVEYCNSTYGSREYISTDRMHDRFPPLLLSFPGAGNTWLRSLIEYSTGFYSGSIDVNDGELKAVLKGENACGLRVSIIKGHPSDLLFKNEPDLYVHVSRRRKVSKLRFLYRQQRKKCSKGMVYYFKRVLLLVRDPFDSILADYQRHATGRHTGRLSMAYLRANHSEWVAMSTNQSLHYRDKMDDLVGLLSKHYSPGDFSTVRYEELVGDPDGRLRALQRVMVFLNYTVPAPRLRCAFVLSDNSRIRRTGRAFNASFAYRDDQHFCALQRNLRTFLGNFSYSGQGVNSRVC